MNNKLKLTVAVLAILPILALSNLALADEATGTLTTGISATNGNPMSGVVVALPIASPAAGTYTATQSVTLTSDGATSINYTTDGTAPTCSTGNTYSSPIAVNSSMTIEAISCYPTSVSSMPVSYLYTINIPAAPVVSNNSVSYSSGGGGGSSAPVTTTVGMSDFVLLMANWGQPGPGNPADFSGDATVGIQDFIWLMANWTK
jgi:hypothetical protein